MHLEPGTKMIVIQDGDNILLKPIKAPRMGQIDKLIALGDKIRNELGLIEYIETRYNDRHCRDLHDDKLVYCAGSGEIKQIVSGDNDLLIFRDISGTRILNVVDFPENIGK